MLKKISKAVTLCSCFFLLSCLEDKSNELKSNLSESLLTSEISNAIVYKNPTYKNRYYSILYKSDDLKVKGIVAFPKHFDPSKTYPVIIYNRGGHEDFGYIDKLNHYFHRLTKDKYIVFASQLRGSPGSEGRDEFGGEDVSDVLNLIAIAKSYSFVDKKNIFMYGASRGGMMNYLVMKSGLSFSAVAVHAGISDAFLSVKNRPRLEERVHKRLIPNYTGNKEKELSKRSVIKWIEKINSPLLLIHGDADWRVNIKHSQMLHKALLDKGHPVSFKIFKGANHSLKGYEKQEMEVLHSWFSKYLK